MRNVPPLFQPHYIVNHIAVQLRKHALQRLDDDLVFLQLYTAGLLRFSRGLARREVLLVVELVLEFVLCGDWPGLLALRGRGVAWEFRRAGG
jgi:hypothetical protein